MMDFSKTLSREFMNKNLLLSSRRLESHMNIDLLMIWLLKPSRVKVVLSGPARITTEMFSPISSLKVLDLSVS
jgi:hypothetical protein